MTMPREVARLAPSGVAFSTRERGIAQGSSAVNAMKITNRYVAFGQRPATREALGRRALPRSQGEHAPVTRSGVGWTFRLGTRPQGGRRGTACWNSPSAAAAGPRASAPGGTEARGRAGVWGSRLRGDRSANARVQALSRQDFRCEDFRHRQDCRASSLAVCRLASHTMFEIGSDSCSYKKIRAFR